MANIDNIVDGKRTIGEKLLLTSLGLTALVGAYFTNPDYKNLDIGVKSVCAQEQQYKTVDDILAPIKNKVFVNKDTYLDEVNNTEKGVVFFYNNVNDSTGYNKRLAQVYSSVANKYPNLKLICYDMDKENLPGRFYLNNFGFKGTPYTMVFIKGKKIFEDKGGPNPESMQDATQGWDANFTEISNM